MQNEIWKEIKDYTNYYVSNKGNILNIYEKAIKRNSKEKGIAFRILKPTIDSNGYCCICLYKNNVSKIFKVHRLVAEAFIKNPKNLPQINHKDENKYNNIVDNLEWCTQQYNMNYGCRNEKVSKNQSKYKIIQMDKNNNIIKIWDNIWELTHNTNFKKYNIYCCCRGKYKTAYGYKWKYCL